MKSVVEQNLSRVDQWRCWVEWTLKVVVKNIRELVIEGHGGKLSTEFYNHVLKFLTMVWGTVDDGRWTLETIVLYNVDRSTVIYGDKSEVRVKKPYASIDHLSMWTSDNKILEEK